MFGLGTTELLIIAVIVLLLFGAKRLPDIGKGLGGAIREFRHVKGDIAGETPKGEPKDAIRKAEAATPAGLEEKVADKIIEQVPGVKQAVSAKKKVDAVKKVLNT